MSTISPERRTSKGRRSPFVNLEKRLPSIRTQTGRSCGSRRPASADSYSFIRSPSASRYATMPPLPDGRLRYTPLNSTPSNSRDGDRSDDHVQTSDPTSESRWSNSRMLPETFISERWALTSPCS